MKTMTLPQRPTHLLSLTLLVSGNPAQTIHVPADSSMIQWASVPAGGRKWRRRGRTRRGRFGNAFRAFASSALILALAGCSGGGGGAGTTLNEGAYDISAFDYVDPEPASFHPLKEDTFRLQRRDEIACLLKPDAGSYEIDDVIAGSPENPIPSSATEGLQVIDASSGDLNGDGRPDLVLVGTTTAPGNRSVGIRVLDKLDGSWVLLDSFELGDPGEDYDVARISLGDLDGDFRDELIVAATHTDETTSWVRILDVPLAPFEEATVAHVLDFPTGREVRAIAADLDDDAAAELVVHVGSFQSIAEGFVFDDLTNPRSLDSPIPLYSAPFSHFDGVPWVPPFVTDVSAELVALNRDADPRDEIAVLFTFANGTLAVSLWDDAVAGLDWKFNVLGALNAGVWSATDPRRMRRVAKGDLDGDGMDELAYVIALPLDTETHMARVKVHWSGASDATEVPFGLAATGWDLEVVDRNADGKLEACVMMTSRHLPFFESGLAVLSHDEHAPGLLSVVYATVGGLHSGVSQVVIAGDDFDNDGVAFKWKGHKYLNLPNPIPLAILAAPPTRAGISQNYGGSSVGYTTSTGTEVSVTTTWGASYSFGAGIDVKDPVTDSGGSLKYTLKLALEKAWGESSSVEKSVSFKGTHEDDVVIFEGTLHMIYEYEVVASSDPESIGMPFTINQPLETKVYKWTRKFFTETFGEDTTVSFEALSHTVGQPDTYPSKASVEALLASLPSEDGFMGDSVTVGQGRGSNALELALEDKMSDSFGWSLELEEEAEVKVVAAVVTGTKAISREAVHETSISKGTKYQGEIGDIATAEDYFQWSYDTGIYAYHYMNSKGIPTHVVGFWTNPWGFGY